MWEYQIYRFRPSIEMMDSWGDNFEIEHDRNLASCMNTISDDGWEVISVQLNAISYEALCFVRRSVQG